MRLGEWFWMDGRLWSMEWLMAPDPDHPYFPRWFHLFSGIWPQAFAGYGGTWTGGVRVYTRSPPLPAVNIIRSLWAYGDYLLTIVKKVDDDYAIFLNNTADDSIIEEVFTTSNEIYDITTVIPGHLIVSTAGGYYETLDAGASWDLINDTNLDHKAIIAVGDEWIYAHDGVSKIDVSDDLARTFTTSFDLDVWEAYVPPPMFPPHDIHDPELTMYPAIGGNTYIICAAFADLMFVLDRRNVDPEWVQILNLSKIIDHYTWGGVHYKPSESVFQIARLTDALLPEFAVKTDTGLMVVDLPGGGNLYKVYRLANAWLLSPTWKYKFSTVFSIDEVPPKITIIPIQDPDGSQYNICADTNISLYDGHPAKTLGWDVDTSYQDSWWMKIYEETGFNPYVPIGGVNRMYGPPGYPEFGSRGRHDLDGALKDAMEYQGAPDCLLDGTCEWTAPNGNHYSYDPDTGCLTGVEPDGDMYYAYNDEDYPGGIPEGSGGSPPCGNTGYHFWYPPNGEIPEVQLRAQTYDMSAGTIPSPFSSTQVTYQMDRGMIQKAFYKMIFINEGYFKIYYNMDSGISWIMPIEYNIDTSMEAKILVPYKHDAFIEGPITKPYVMDCLIVEEVIPDLERKWPQAFDLYFPFVLGEPYNSTQEFED